MKKLANTAIFASPNAHQPTEQTMTHDNEQQRDEYIARRTAIHAAEIRAKLVAGNPSAVADMDEAMGVILFDSAAWAALIQSTANGENAFAKLLDKAITDAAEILALKDAEQVDAEIPARRRAYVRNAYRAPRFN